MTHNLSQLPLVTTSVVSSSDNSIVLPWTIIQFDELYSVADFFTMTIKPRLEIDECLLQDARVGQAAHLLVLVDMNLPLMAIIPTFGRFLQFKVSISDPTKVTVDSNEPQEVALYIPVIPERNRKDALYNKIVSFFKSTSLGLLEEEISSGKKLISCLRDVFSGTLMGIIMFLKELTNPFQQLFPYSLGIMYQNYLNIVKGEH